MSKDYNELADRVKTIEKHHLDIVDRLLDLENKLGIIHETDDDDNFDDNTEIAKRRTPSRIKKSQEDNLSTQLLKELKVYKAEKLCFSLKSALVNFDLNYPPIESFERNLQQITETGDVLYIMQLIHDCWCLVYPDALFDRPTKRGIDIITLQTVLSKFSGDNPEKNYDVITNEINKDDINVLKIKYYREFANLSARMQGAYRKYMQSLYEVCKTICKNHDIELESNFLIPDYIISTNKLTVAQVNNVFLAMANEKKMHNNPDTAAAFRALFGMTLNAVERRICWLDVSKSHKPNFLSLYKMFEAMGVEMNKFNRAIICKYFTTSDGAIEPESLRPREKNKSKARNRIEEMVKEALQIKPTP